MYLSRLVAAFTTFLGQRCSFVGCLSMLGELQGFEFVLMALETDVRAHEHLALVLCCNFLRLPPGDPKNRCQQRYTPAHLRLRERHLGNNTASCQLTARPPLR